MGSNENLEGIPFTVRDRVVVTGGYEQFPEWLAGGDGYLGTLVDISDNRALVELDADIEVGPPRSKDAGWMVWPKPTDEPDRIAHPSGRWLVLSQGWAGSVWNEPTDRLHVLLCASYPDIRLANLGGTSGAWVEGYAGMKHARRSYIFDESPSET